MLAFSMAVAVNSLVKYALCLYFCYWRLIMSVLLMQKNSLFWQLMDWMVHTKGMNMSYTNHAIRLDLIYKVRGIEAAEKYFDGLPDPAKNHRTYGALLNCYCSSKKEEKATDIYRKMDELGISSSTLPINNLMSLYMKLGQHK
jgi:pentatricopeptide repeat protein